MTTNPKGAEALTAEYLADLLEKAEKATPIAPGTWEHDSERNEGAYGSGPDATHGFSSYFMMDNRGRRLFDSYNSEVADVNEDEDSAWDENSRRVFDFVSAANPATLKLLIPELLALRGEAEKLTRERDEAVEAAERLKGVLTLIAGQTPHDTTSKADPSREHYLRTVLINLASRAIVTKAKGPRGPTLDGELADLRALITVDQARAAIEAGQAERTKAQKDQTHD